MAKSSRRSSRLNSLFGLDYPIVQGPFGGGLSSVELASTVANLGGLGSFGCQPYKASEIAAFATAIKQKTNKAFNLNLWVDDRDEALTNFDKVSFEKVKEIFAPYFSELKVAMPEWPLELGPQFENQIQAVLDAKPPVFSFVFGIPNQDILDKCRSLGIRIVGTATTVDEAVALENAGVDAIVATGFEAGGHRVSFLQSPKNSLTGAFALIPQVSDAVKVPVIAAGGIADARGVRAAFSLGADGVQIGTAFLATRQSNALEEHKEKLFSEEAKYTVLTKMFSGRLARGIRSRLTDELSDKEDLMAPYPLQAVFLSKLRASMIENHKSDYITFWSGQAAPLLKHHDATELFESLLEGIGQE